MTRQRSRRNQSEKEEQRIREAVRTSRSDSAAVAHEPSNRALSVALSVQREYQDLYARIPPDEPGLPDAKTSLEEMRPDLEDANQTLQTWIKASGPVGTGPSKRKFAMLSRALLPAYDSLMVATPKDIHGVGVEGWRETVYACHQVVSDGKRDVGSIVGAVRREMKSIKRQLEQLQKDEPDNVVFASMAHVDNINEWLLTAHTWSDKELQDDLQLYTDAPTQIRSQAARVGKDRPGLQAELNSVAARIERCLARLEMLHASPAKRLDTTREVLQGLSDEIGGVVGVP